MLWKSAIHTEFFTYLRDIAVLPLAALLILLGAPTPASAQDNTSVEGLPRAVVLIYHRFGEDDYPSTSVAMDQFRSHIELLKTGGYNVLPVPDILDAIRTGTALPEKTVGITVDDAYLSLYERAFPLLKEAGFPFTLFVATDPVDRKHANYMTWDQIRTIHKTGATIGSQAVTHPHMPGLHEDRIARELNLSADRIEEELGERPKLFAYPYGEASLETMKATKEAGYTAAFGQHSGAMNPTNNMYYLPRFPVNVNYGGIDRFRRIVNSKPLPVRDLVPTNPFLSAKGETNPPVFGFTVTGNVERLGELACYHSDAGKITALELLGPRIEVRFDRAFAAGRTRINCTVPTNEGGWRWFGMQYYVKP